MADNQINTKRSTVSEHQRKIELQSPQDLTYLINNVRTAAQQQLDLHLPPSAVQGDDDAFRIQVNEHVQRYVNDIWKTALPSLSINGLDATPTILAPKDSDDADLGESDYEPFDTRLAQRLRDLYVTLEEETTAIAGLRREAPKKATNTYMEALAEAIEADEKDLEARQTALSSEKSIGISHLDFSNPSEVKQSWDQSRRELEELRNVTIVKANLERAIRAAGEVEKK